VPVEISQCSLAGHGRSHFAAEEGGREASESFSASAHIWRVVQNGKPVAWKDGEAFLLVIRSALTKIIA